MTPHCRVAPTALSDRNRSLIYRLPLVLCHMEGFSTKEIAKLCGVPLGTVLARLHRGRKAFEREMWAYAEEMGLLKSGARHG